MNRTPTCAAMLSILGCAIVAQGAEITLDPGRATLRVRTLDKPKAVETQFPFDSTDRQGFTASVKVELGTWNHYASLRMGFRSSRYGSRFEALLSKGDDGLRGVAMDLEVASGAGYQSTLCYVSPDVKSIVIALHYNAHRSRFKMIVSHDNRVLGESDWIKIRGYFSLDEFVVQVGRGKDGLQPGSSLAWDPNAAALRAVSHIGDEGGYKYYMEAHIKQAAIRTTD